MTRATRILAAAVLAAVVAWSLPGRPAQAASWSLFVRRSWVPSMQHGGKIFAPAEALLKALGYSWSGGGGSIAATPGAGGGPALRTSALTISLNGRTVSPPTLYYKGQSWVMVKPVAAAAGGLYIESPSVGMAQVVFTKERITQADLNRAVKEARTLPPVEAKPEVAPTESKEGVTPTEGKEGGETASKEEEKGGTADEEDAKTAEINKKRKDPLKATADISNPAIPGANYPADVRGSYSVKNEADLPVKNVQIQIVIVDQTEQPVAQGELEPRYVSEIAPGETVTGDIHWWNYQNLLNVTPKVKLKFDPLPEKKAPKKEKKAEGVPGSKSGAKPAGK